jgi:hypothetical protein
MRARGSWTGEGGRGRGILNYRTVTIPLPRSFLGTLRLPSPRGSVWGSGRVPGTLPEGFEVVHEFVSDPLYFLARRAQVETAQLLVKDAFDLAGGHAVDLVSRRLEDIRLLPHVVPSDQGPDEQLLCVLIDHDEPGRLQHLQGSIDAIRGQAGGGSRPTSFPERDDARLLKVGLRDQEHVHPLRALLERAEVVVVPDARQDPAVLACRHQIRDLSVVAVRR